MPSTIIPDDGLPPDFDPRKPLTPKLDVPQMPAFDKWPYKPPQDPSDPDSGTNDPTPPENPDGGNGSGALSGTGTVSERLNAIENAINCASISAECNEDGTITVTLTWGATPCT